MLKMSGEVLEKLEGRSRSYTGEFEALFECALASNGDLDDFIRGQALELKFVGGCRFRSICWRLFLDCLPEETDQWHEALKKNREEFVEKQNLFDYNPRDAQQDMDDPLSQRDDSKWKQYFDDEELRQMIQQDVVRTWPDIAVFQTESVRQIMTSILFYYSRSKPNLSYRQGMHEILAPIIYALYADQDAYRKALDSGEISRLSDSNRRLLADLLSVPYTAHDAYSMFSSLMETLESWYSYSVDSDCTRSQELEQKPFAKNTMDVQTILGLKLGKISYYILKRLDPPLYQHLQNFEINPQVYGIRWLRLLFSREFCLRDVLCLWDTILADSISLDLADYIFVAMLITIRHQLLSSDYSSCLSLLMRYPEDVDVSSVIKLALQARDHYKNPKNLTPLPSTISTPHSLPVQPSLSSLTPPQQATSSSPKKNPPQVYNTTPNQHQRANRPQTLDFEGSTTGQQRAVPSVKNMFVPPGAIPGGLTVLDGTPSDCDNQWSAGVLSSSGVSTQDDQESTLTPGLSSAQTIQTLYSASSATSHSCASLASLASTSSNNLVLIGNQSYPSHSSAVTKSRHSYAQDSGSCNERELIMSSSCQELMQLRARIAECTLAMDAHLATLQQCLVHRPSDQQKSSKAVQSSSSSSSVTNESSTNEVPLNEFEAKRPIEDALIALAQLKSVRDQLKESINIEELEDESLGGWTVVPSSSSSSVAAGAALMNEMTSSAASTSSTASSSNGIGGTLKKKLLNGLIRGD